MSGGTFDYQQYKFSYIADAIEQEVVNNGKKIEYDINHKMESWEDEFYQTRPPEVIEKFKEAIKAIKIAQIYANRIDYLLADDDGNETFIKRLNKELEELQCHGV